MARRPSDDDIYDFTVIGYMDRAGNRQFVPPEDRAEFFENLNLRTVYGVRVEVQNVDDPEDRHQFWVYNYDPEKFENWAEWFVYIGAIMERHGFTFAEE